MKYSLSQFKAFVFDLDGTLIDSERYHADGFAHAVEHVSGYRITDDERREFFEGHTSFFVPVLNDRHGLEMDDAEVLQHKRAHVRDHFKTDVFPGAVSFLKRWRNRTRMALASNSPKHFVKNALIEGKMIDLFEAVCTADDVARRKPDPEMYTLVLERLKLSVNEVLIFEDSPAGVAAAQAAG
jgi:HAD superfamily hydrolase (TIGR01509 family)